MVTERTLRGEGTLTLAERLGGKAVLAPVAAAFLAVVVLAVIYEPDPGRPEAWLPFAAGAALPLWIGHRCGLWRGLLAALRGEPARAWRIDVDDLGVRHVDLDGSHAQSFEWFEIERFATVELGIVLWLRVPKGGANAVLLPRRFFPLEAWEPLLALVREKLPSAARAADEGKRASEVARRSRARRAILLWLALVAAAAVFWTFFAER